MAGANQVCLLVDSTTTFILGFFSYDCLKSLSLEDYAHLSQIIGAIFTIVIAYLVYRHTKKMDSISFYEQSFDALQEINAVALSSEENLRAAIASVGGGEEYYDDSKARIFYFHYMRINRLYRAYEYRKAHKWNFFARRSADRIISSHITSIKRAEPFLTTLMERGYPEDFRVFLKERLAKSNLASFISSTDLSSAHTAPPQSPLRPSVPARRPPG